MVKNDITWKEFFDIGWIGALALLIIILVVYLCFYYFGTLSGIIPNQEDEYAAKWCNEKGYETGRYSFSLYGMYIYCLTEGEIKVSCGEEECISNNSRRSLMCYLTGWKEEKPIDLSCNSAFEW